MSRKGMNDKDMIKHLKSKGYSYETIERAMLQAVKQGVSEPKRFAREMPAMSAPPAEEFSMPAGEDFGAESFDMLAEQPVFEQVPAEGGEELAIEELIEGIVEDKWNRFQDSTKQLEERVERLRAETQSLEAKLRESRNDAPMREVDARLAEFSDHIDDIDARVGGLEKAFKQFLPALTRNIESLSSMIQDMKARGVAASAE